MPPKVKKLNFGPLLKEIKKSSKTAKESVKRYGLPTPYKGRGRQSLLDAAVEVGDVEMMKLLIQKGCLVHMKIMYQAIEQQNVKMIDAILETDKTLIRGKVYEMPPLIYAAKKKAENVVKFLLKKKADWAVTDTLGESVLHGAAEDVEDDETYDPDSAINIMKIFLAKKMPVDIENSDGETPLHLACKSQQKQVVEFLLSQKANLNACDKKGNSALHIVIENTSHSRFDYQGYNFEFGKNLDEIEEDRKKAEFIDWLISKGSNFQLQNNVGESPLYLAVVYRQKEVIKVLLRHCTKISDADNNNAVFDIFLKAFLMKANETADEEIVEMIREFLQKGAAIDRINKYGDNPIDLVNTQDATVRKIILQHSGKMDSCNENNKMDY